MRILYVCPDDGIPVLGAKGGAVHVREMIAALARAGHQVILAAPVGLKSSAEEPAALAGEFVEIAPSAATEKMAAGMRSFLGRVECDKSAARSVRRMLYDNELAAALLDRFAGDPPDLIYCRAALLSTAAAQLARATVCPLVVELNAPLAAEQAAYRSGSLMELAVAAERFLLQAADAVLVVSHALVGHVEALGVAAERVHVQPNAIDPAQFRPGEPDPLLRERLGLGAGPLLGFVGGLKPWHGVDSLPELLARLAPRVPGVQLLVVGDGPMRGAMVERLEACGMAERVVFAGNVAHEAIPEHIRLFDAALAPYPRPEREFYFSPLKLFEYMGCGAAVVVPRIGQIAEMVEDGCTGLLHAPGDMNALAKACERVLMDRELKQRLGNAAAARIHAQHTWDQSAMRVIALAGQPEKAAA